LRSGYDSYIIIKREEDLSETAERKEVIIITGNMMVPAHNDLILTVISLGRISGLISSQVFHHIGIRIMISALIQEVDSLCLDSIA
jgi:hypothetical protein